MKKIITIINIPSLGIRGLLFFLLFSFFFANAQKELWGVNKGVDDGDPNSTGYKGNITKYDIDGKNPVIMHEFTDFATGKTPKGKLFLASNGKLYGTTVAGGNATPPGSSFANGFGVLYEYDLVLDKYRVVNYFNIQDGNGIKGFGVIEPITGKLYGGISTKIFCYDLATETFTLLTTEAGYFIDGEFMKASNGLLYNTTTWLGCSGYDPQIWNGTIFSVNTTTNTVSTVHYLACNGSEGIGFTGGLIEAQPGKLYGTTSWGIDYTSGSGIEIYGTIFEFDIATNTFTKKINFDGNNLGSNPQPLVNGGNGKLYGVCQQGGTCNYLAPNGNTYTYHIGTLFEYTPTSNTLIKLHDMCNDFGGGYPLDYIKTSTSNYFCVFNPSYMQGGSSGYLFKYNLDTDVCISPTTINAQVDNIIEICRKPSYHEITTNTYAPSVGDAFTYDIQNTNATTYVWQNGTTVLPTQTTAVLNIASVATTDSGTYTCTMTNECGTTTTAPIYLNVSLGVDAFSLENSITLYPNPTNSWLTINLPKNNEIEIQKCTIATIEGKRVYKSTENNTKIDVSGFAKGIYIITLKTNLGDWSGKFVKE